MWQAIEILLIATFALAGSDANLAQESEAAPLTGAGELYPAMVVDQGGKAQASPAQWVDRPGNPPPMNGTGYCHDSPGWLAGPCVFDSYWDVTGGRPPTDYMGVWGYGPDCTVGRARIEWLLWFSQGRHAPDLVRTTNVPSGSTTPVTRDYPSELIGLDIRNGARITAGRLLADDITWVEGRFWGLENSSETFAANSGHTPLIARPYFDVLLNREARTFVAFPGLAVGDIHILSRNSLFGADAWARQTWWTDGCHRFDFLAGYQFTRLDDSIVIDQSSSTLAGFHVAAHDSFQTQNTFNGGTLGFVSEWRKKVLSLELLGKMGLGNVYQRVAIEGHNTTSTAGGPTTPHDFGFLAQPSNIGDRHRNRFTYVPELNVNGTVHFSPQWRMMVGYSILFWNNVVLAGNQIDTRVNLSQDPPGPLVGPALPQFRFVRSDFWVQGISLGTEYRW